MEEKIKVLNDMLPFWSSLKGEDKSLLIQNSTEVNFEKGSTLNTRDNRCSGLFLVLEGRIRAFVVTDEGKEVTLFRLLDRDLCIFSASCMMQNINFDVSISAETDVKALQILPQFYDGLSKRDVNVSNFTNEVLSSRLSDIMWVLEQILFMRFDRRLALFILDQSSLEGSDKITITHEQIASHLGSAREVVTRMLSYFAKEGYVSLSRGSITVENRKELIRISEDKK